MSRYYCLKVNLHCHSDERAGPTRRPHRSSYPLAEVLRLFRSEGYDALALTEHIPAASAESYELARRLRPQLCPEMIIIPGREVGDGFHAVELLDGEDVAFRILAHPARGREPMGLIPFVEKIRSARKLDAIELDATVGIAPGFLPEYAKESEQLGLPPIASSDFHGDLLVLKNNFTVCLCRERSAKAILEAIRRGEYVSFYMDLPGWKRGFYPGGSPLCKEWIAGAGPEKFDRPFAEFLVPIPPMKPDRMRPEDISSYHASDLLWLEDGDLSVLVLPGRGGRIAGLYLAGRQLCAPLTGMAIETESVGEVFETSFSPYEVVERSETHVAMEYEIVDRNDFAGLRFRKSIDLAGGEVVVATDRINRSRSRRRIVDTIRFMLAKPFGGEARAEVKLPEQATLTMPVNYLGKCRTGADAVLAVGDAGLDLATEDQRLRELRLWSRTADLCTLAILVYEENVLDPGAESAPYVIRLRPWVR